LQLLVSVKRLVFKASCVSECFGDPVRRALMVYVSIGSKSGWNTRSVPASPPCSAPRVGPNLWNPRSLLPSSPAPLPVPKQWSRPRDPAGGRSRSVDDTRNRSNRLAWRPIPPGALLRVRLRQSAARSADSFAGLNPELSQDCGGRAAFAELSSPYSDTVPGVLARCPTCPT
jgi:hypothetical protein